MSKSQGTTWNKWDLHIHTPLSIEQGYGGDTEKAWEKFIGELANLDKQIKVIGISDYWFIDGYKKVVQAKKDGLLPNIETIFPVIETRVDKFGTAKKDGLSRVNIHFLMNPDEDIDRLYAALAQNLKCQHEAEAVNFTSTIRPDALDELGRQLLAQAKKNGQPVNDSPRQMGFANFQAQFTLIRDALKTDKYLRENVLVFMGRREWEDIKWGGSATAEKHSLMGVADGVFTASPTREDALRCVNTLRGSDVNSKVLHASDAHEWSVIPSEPRSLGHLFTWINADLSFAGLRHALTEYDSRVSFDAVPRSVRRLTDQPETILENIVVSGDSENDDLFHLDLPLSSGFVVVIGNKGQGKSALLDTVAFGSHSGREDDYSFLRKDRFLGDPLSSNYKVELTWANGKVSERRLGESHDESETARAEYLPQQLVERICSADPTTVKGAQLETEIERVIFQHIPVEQRCGSNNFSELREKKLADIQLQMRESRVELRDSIERWVQAIRERDDLESKKLHESKGNIESLVDEKTIELDNVVKKLERDDSSNVVSKAREIRLRLEKTERLVEQRVKNAQERWTLLDGKDNDLDLRIEKLRQIVHQVNEQAQELESSHYISGRLAQATFDSVVESEFRTAIRGDKDFAQEWLAAWQEKKKTVTGQIAEIQRVIDENSENPDLRLAEGIRKQIHELQNGDGTNAPSVVFVESQIQRLQTLSEEVGNSWESIKKNVISIHGSIQDELECKEQLYSYAASDLEFLTKDNDIAMEFSVDTHVREFKNSWVDFVNKQKLGALEDLSSLDFDENFFQSVDLGDADAIWGKLGELLSSLERERADLNGDYRGLSNILRAGKSVEDLVEQIFGMKWLLTRYRIAADERDLNQLSPGQRGLILLLFYLLLDRQSKPLLLDQPEENLDNESIKSLLLPAIRQAVQRRQIIAVTHNANLAVVGDADQVIHAKQTAEGKFSYVSGSLIDFRLGNPIVDVLEGSHSAFRNRGTKYADMKLYTNGVK
ncbi:TrlF family AAA-like ATPase [Glutamicibacter sp. 287]|uniref:TrlF family AAA-like ATPase n=1 Tax=Glutamicibacter sp. 287 TaxID=3457732 RepID=UPI004034352E